MKGFHCNWTKPYFCRNDGFPRNKNDYMLSDYDILMTVLSALKWREKNGTIKLYTDSFGAKYYRNNNMEFIWNGGIDESLDYLIPSNIDPLQFWAAAKIFALKNEQEDIAIVDLDLVVWENLDEFLSDSKIIVAHKESFSDVYPSYTKNKIIGEFVDEKNLDWSVIPCNTSFLYINDKYFKDYYCNLSIEFMHRGSEIEDSMKEKVIYMVFAEQRLLSMCAKEKNIDIKSVISTNHDLKFSNYITHLWGYKYELETHYWLKMNFCESILKIIKKEYPQYIEDVLKIPCVSKFRHILLT